MLLIIIIVVGILIAFISAWSSPASDYYKTYRSLFEFHRELAPRQHTTSSSNALRHYRQLIESGDLDNPEVLNDTLEKLFVIYLEKYPRRCRRIVRYHFDEDSRYSLTLYNKSNNHCWKWTWTEIQSFDPERERKLMTSKLRLEIKTRDDYTCQLCGKSMHEDSPGLIHIDHIVPVSKGGRTEACNLQVLCVSCNLTKSNK